MNPSPYVIETAGPVTQRLLERFADSTGVAPPSLDELTERELEILRLIAAVCPALRSRSDSSSARPL
jgi:hypothetical protein